MNQSGVSGLFKLAYENIGPFATPGTFHWIEKYTQTRRNVQTQNISIYKSHVDWDNLLESKW